MFIVTVRDVPYFENFEGPTATEWTPVGINNSWALGYPMKPNINSPYSGVNCWTTGGLNGTYSINERSSLISPVFDFTNVTGTVAVSVALRYKFFDDLGSDGSNLQYSLN